MRGTSRFVTRTINGHRPMVRFGRVAIALSALSAGQVVDDRGADRGTEVARAFAVAAASSRAHGRPCRGETCGAGHRQFRLSSGAAGQSSERCGGYCGSSFSDLGFDKVILKKNLGLDGMRAALTDLPGKQLAQTLRLRILRDMALRAMVATISFPSTLASSGGAILIYRPLPSRPSLIS
jgi:hypothetical protein